jgi:hypothetical protein
MANICSYNLLCISMLDVKLITKLLKLYIISKFTITYLIKLISRYLYFVYQLIVYQFIRQLYY